MATTAAFDHDVVQGRPVRRIAGEAGIWFFILSDMLLEFGTIFGCFLYHRSLNPDLFSRSAAALSPTLGLLNTLFLLTSSLFVALAVQSLRTGSRSDAAKFFAWGRALGLCFIVVKLVEHGSKLAVGVTPMSDIFSCTIMARPVSIFCMLSQGSLSSPMS